ncbi:MAG: hypothetical protein FWD73_03150 [Polyangiaceae bacterium]|nr:hypothetical protein [Polyangiaceae bacterium]
MDSRPGGFEYWVSDEQLATFAAATPAARLAWLEQMREFTYRVATDQTRERWRKLRRGE